MGLRGEGSFVFVCVFSFLLYPKYIIIEFWKESETAR